MAEKGLKSNVVGLFGGTMLGISSVAPAYALTATLGILAASVGAKTPVVIIAGFLPMFFAAYAYREFNRIMPDAGTSFTWTSKAFGPYIGWLGGWAAVLATIIVLSNLAGVAVQFLYQFIGSAVNSEMISGLWENKLINVVTCLVFLAIATYKALPPAFAKLHPVHRTPSVATFTAGIGAAAFYTIMTFLSERVLTDTIYSLGIMICFYYGLTAFGCIWFFRHQLFDNAFNFVFKFLFPLLGGLGLFFVLIITLRDSADPSYGSGASIGGIGLVLILGLGLILAGLVVMAILRARQPAFFRGETIIHESAHAMRPHEHLVS
jgi:amino acid transporter